MPEPQMDGESAVPDSEQILPLPVDSLPEAPMSMPADLAEGGLNEIDRRTEVSAKARKEEPATLLAQYLAAILFASWTAYLTMPPFSWWSVATGLISLAFLVTEPRLRGSLPFLREACFDVYALTVAFLMSYSCLHEWQFWWIVPAIAFSLFLLDAVALLAIRNNLPFAP